LASGLVVPGRDGDEVDPTDQLFRRAHACSLPHNLTNGELGDGAPARRGATLAERMIEANGVELCTEPFGDPGDPPVLLIMGVGASMMWWEEGLCRKLAAEGRYVIRYDHRDTGRSITYEPGHPTYTADDLIDDAVGVLGAYGIPAAHLVGVSAGGAFSQLL